MSATGMKRGVATLSDPFMISGEIPHFPGRYGRLKHAIFWLARRCAPWLRNTGWTRLAYRPFLRRPRFPHIIIEIRNLPEVFEGYRIAHVSDLHGGLATDSRGLIPWFQRLPEMSPDLIAITGDFICFDERDLPFVLDSLDHLEAPDGVIAILGNHDYYGGDPKGLMQRVEERGIRCLINECVEITRVKEARTFTLSILGLDDLEMGNPCFETALQNQGQERMTTIALAHHPDTAHSAPPNRIDLQLSGHTHGGQIRLPWIGAIAKGSDRGLVYGLHRTDSTQVFITRGLGAVLLPIRCLCPAEIPIIELRRARD